MQQEADTRLGVIVDMQPERKKEMHDVLKRFVAKLEPESQVLILDMEAKDKAYAGHHWRKAGQISASDADLVYGRQDTHHAIQLKPLVELFLTQLDSNVVDGDVAGELVIVTAGFLSDTQLDVDAMADKLRAKNVALRVVVYPYTAEHQRDLDVVRELVAKAQGTIHLVAREDTQPDGPAGAKVALRAAFDAMPGDSNYYQHVLIARQPFNMSVQRHHLTFNFLVDTSLAQPGVKIVAGLSANYELKTARIQLRSSNGTQFTAKQNEFKRSRDQFEVVLNYPFATTAAGEWKLEYISDRDDPLIAYAFALVPRRVKAITARCWLSNPNSILTQPAEQPLVMYTSVTENFNKLVQRAKVRVTLTDDQGRPLAGHSAQPLLDNGVFADGDVTSGDAIYSNFYAQLLPPNAQPGYYGATVTVQSGEGATRMHFGLRSSDIAASTSKLNNPLTACCGQSVPEFGVKFESVYNLQRTVDCGMIYVGHETLQKIRNYSPPITDLRVRAVDPIERTVTVTWSEPVNVRYEYRVFREHERGFIKRMFDSYGQPAEQVNLSGPRERQAVVNITSPEGGRYYLAIKTIASGSGGENRLSKVSNVVNFVMSADPNAATAQQGNFSLL